MCDGLTFLTSGAPPQFSRRLCHTAACAAANEHDENQLTGIPVLAAAIAFALRFHGRKRVHNADELMSAIVTKPWSNTCSDRTLS
jgi:hypothetical protein